MTSAARDPAWGGTGGGGVATLPPFVESGDLFVVGDLIVRGGSPWFDVEAFGAVGAKLGDTVVDCTQAILDAHTAAVANGYGTIRFRPGCIYGVQAGALSFSDTSGRIAWEGGGLRDSNEFFGSVLKALGGTGHTFDVHGSAGTQGSVSINGLSVDGSSLAGVSGWFFDRVSTPHLRIGAYFCKGTAFQFRRVYNAYDVPLLFAYGCGTGETDPVLLFDAHSGDSQPGSSQFLIDKYFAFACRGTELKVGDASQLAAGIVEGVQISNLIVERDAQTANYTMLDLANSQDFKAGIARLRIDGAADPSTLVRQNGIANTRLNKFGLLELDHGGAPTYFVDQGVGKLVIGTLDAIHATAPTAYWHIGSGVSSDGAIVGAFRSSSGSLRYQDDRAAANQGQILPPFLAFESLTYAATMTPSLNRSSGFKISVTDGVAMTIANPTNPKTGQRVVFQISNNSGGAMGAITWGALYKLAGAFTNPASTKTRTIEFVVNDSGSLVEIGRAAADI